MGLDTYVIEPRMIDVGGKSLSITPLRVRQIPAFTRNISSAAHLLLVGKAVQAVVMHGEDIVKAMAVATDQSEADLGELLPDDFLLLVTTVMEVNADFFAQRVAPQIQAIREKADAALKTSMNGAIPSPASSSTATA